MDPICLDKGRRIVSLLLFGVLFLASGCGADKPHAGTGGTTVTATGQGGSKGGSGGQGGTIGTGGGTGGDAGDAGPTCTPKCAGKNCGPDGCGGECGTCGAGTCDKGHCSTLGVACNVATQKPCVPGERCMKAAPVGVHSNDIPRCKPDVQDVACTYNCSGCGNDWEACDYVAEYGNSGYVCRGYRCEAYCTSDTDCLPNEFCRQVGGSTAKSCQSTCDLWNPGAACLPGERCSISYRASAWRTVCFGTGAKGVGSACKMYSPGDDDCGAGLVCLGGVCRKFCDGAHPCTDPSMLCADIVFNGQSVGHSACQPPPCFPDCTGKTCGDDGCGGSCGVCSGNNVCVAGACQCAPSCTGKVCGSDGCGGSCGTCGGGQVCFSGQCCTPSCFGKTCGSDGCGGSCGTCQDPEVCTNGQCACTPSCTGKNCGSDGCFGSCGGCSGGDVCAAGKCTNPTSCSGAGCLAGFAGGGCCASSPYCVSPVGQVTKACNSACGKIGQGCLAASDCCSPLDCMNNVCQ